MTTKLITPGPIKEKVPKTLSSGPPILRTVSLSLSLSFFFELLRIVILIVLAISSFGAVGEVPQQNCVLKCLNFLFFRLHMCQSVEIITFQ